MNSEPAVPQAIAVSVIVPVYNVQSWVGNWLKSILDQDFALPFEIIVIDDCYTDASVGSCRECQCLPPEIAVLIECEQNGGASQAQSLLLIVASVYRYRLRKSGATGGKLETGACHDWRGSVEGSSDFARNQRQEVAHRSLLLQTPAQVARECRDIDPALAAGVLETIEQKCRDRSTGPGSRLFGSGADLRAPGHDLKPQVALRQVRRAIEKQLP